VELSGWQKHLYTQLKNEWLQSGPSEEGKMMNMEHTIVQLRKACNHPYLFWQEGGVDLDEAILARSENLYRSSGKFEMLDRILPKLRVTGHKVLILTQMTEVLDVVEKFLTWRQWNFLRLDDAEKAEDAPDDNWIFLLTARAGSVDLNLLVADTVIMFESDWKPQIHMHHAVQSEVRVYQIITAMQAEGNLNRETEVEKEDDDTPPSFAADRKTQLQRLRQEEDSDQSQESLQESAVISWEECNGMLARSVEELALFEKMDKDLLTSSRAEWERDPLPTASEMDGKSWPGRLMGVSELPDWMLISHQHPIWKAHYGRSDGSTATHTVDEPRPSSKGAAAAADSSTHSSSSSSSNRMWQCAFCGHYSNLGMANCINCDRTAAAAVSAAAARFAGVEETYQQHLQQQSKRYEARLHGGGAAGGSSSSRSSRGTAPKIGTSKLRQELAREQRPLQRQELLSKMRPDMRATEQSAKQNQEEGEKKKKKKKKPQVADFF